MTRAAWRQGALLLAAGALLLLATLTVRMLYGAQQQLQLAQAAASPQEEQTRWRHLRRAMAYYLPGNPWVRRAHDQLLAEARQALATGQPARAAAILHELRSAVLALRGLSQPFGDTLPEINAALATLQSQDPAAAPALRGAAGAHQLHQRLSHPQGVQQPWAALGVLGFLLWVFAAALLLARGLRPDASIVWHRCCWLAAGVALGQLLFWIGLARA
jgi:hypothetical protein